MEKGLFNKLYLKSIKTVREGLWHLSYNPLPSFSPPSSGRRKFPECVHDLQLPVKRYSICPSR